MKLTSKLKTEKKGLWALALQFVKFGIVGVSNTLINLGIYYILIFLKVNYIAANTVGFIISVLNAYYWNNKYVFKSKGKIRWKDHLKPLLKVYASYGITFVLSTVLLYVFVHYMHISKITAPIINLFITTPINFLLNKFWAFGKKSNKKTNMEEIMTTEELAYRIRRHAVEMTHASHASHIASVLSVADIVAVLYGKVMKIYPDDPKNDNRDRFILSKGHAGIAVYSVLAEMGYFPTDDLKNYYQNGSNLSGHISHKNVPGAEVSTGALGHGVCMAAGMAMAAKLDNKSYHVYSVVGDGECEEGSVWEMALFASHNKLSNFTVIVDHNKYQAMGPCKEVLGLSDLAKKWEAFGFKVLECDGNNHSELLRAFSEKSDGRPICIVANTVKGKGISFMENNLIWHYRDPQGEDYDNAVKELEKEKNA